MIALVLHCYPLRFAKKSQPIRDKTKTNCDLFAHVFPAHSWCQLRVIAMSFDWFIGLSVSAVIGQSDNFGFGFTTLD